MKEREFSFTYRAEKGFLYERIIFSLGEPLIMVGRVNNGLFTPARKRFSSRFWMIEAVAGVAVGAQRRARCVVPASSLRPRRALLIPANNDVTQAIRRFLAKAERDSLARRTGRRGVAGYFIPGMAARGVGYRQYGVMLFDVVKRQAPPLPVRDKQQRFLLRLSTQP